MIELQVGKSYKSVSGNAVRIHEQVAESKLPVFVGTDARIYSHDGKCIDDTNLNDLIEELLDEDKMAAIIEAIYNTDEFNIEMAYEYFVLRRGIVNAADQPYLYTGKTPYNYSVAID